MAKLATDERGVVLACGACGQKNRVPFDHLGDEGRCGHCGAALPAPDACIEVVRAEAFDALVEGAALPVLVDFWAGWCGPCHMLAPELEKVASSARGRLLVAKVDTDALPDVSGRFGIRSIPTIILFRAGREVGRQSGALPAAGVEAFVRETLGRD